MAESGAQRLGWVLIAAFAAALAAVAYSYREPGVPAGTHWCPAITAVDFIPNHTAGLALRAGLPIYDNLRSHGGDFADPIPDHEGIVSRFGYPPLVAYLFYPLGFFSRAVAWRLWLIGVVASMTLAVAVLSKAGGGPVLAGALLIYYPVWFVLINGNIAALCLPLLAIGVYFLVSGRSEALAALFFALATALKLYPGIFLLYFAVRRKWKLLFWMGFFLLAIVLVTSHGGVYRTFPDRAVRYDRFVQAWYPNASLFSLLVMAGVPVQASFVAARIFAVVIIGGALLWLRRPAEGRLLSLHECGLLSLAMILAPNTNYDYNLIFAMPAFAALLGDVRVGRRGWPLLLAGLSFAVLSIPTHLLLAAVGTSGAAVSKFPWLLLLFLALGWREPAATSPGAMTAGGR